MALVRGTIFDELNRPIEIDVAGTTKRRYTYDTFTQLSAVELGSTVAYHYDE